MKDGSHFYTANDSERDFLINSFGGIYDYEGIAFKAYSALEGPGEGKVGVVRYFNSETNSHLYSTSEYEQNILNQSASFQNEGIAWYSDAI